MPGRISIPASAIDFKQFLFILYSPIINNLIIKKKYLQKVKTIFFLRNLLEKLVGLYLEKTFIQNLQNI